METYLGNEKRQNLLASDIAMYGNVNWKHLKHAKGSKMPGGLAGYMHDLIAFMQDEDIYTKKFSAVPSERIDIDKSWGVAFDGNHRVLALKILGPHYVKSSGMDKWVSVVKV